MFSEWKRLKRALTLSNYVILFDNLSNTFSKDSIITSRRVDNQAEVSGRECVLFLFAPSVLYQCGSASTEHFQLISINHYLIDTRLEKIFDKMLFTYNGTVTSDWCYSLEQLSLTLLELSLHVLLRFIYDGPSHCWGFRFITYVLLPLQYQITLFNLHPFQYVILESLVILFASLY